MSILVQGGSDPTSLCIVPKKCKEEKHHDDSYHCL